MGVPVYPTLTTETTKYTLEKSKAKTCFVGKLDRGPLEQTQKGVLEELRYILFPL